MFGASVGLTGHDMQIFIRHALRRAWFMPTAGLCMRNAAFLGLPLYPLTILSDLYSSRILQNSLEKENIPDVDHWHFASGVAVVHIAAMSRRRSSVLEWQRYFRSANLGVVPGMVPWYSRASVLGWQKYFRAATLGVTAGMASWCFLHREEAGRTIEK